MNGKNISGQDNTEELRRLAAYEKNRTQAADRKRDELEELRRRMEAREARAEAAAAEALASNNIEELRRRLAARKAAAEQGIEYGSGGSHGHGRGSRREKRRPAMALAAGYAYSCAPVLGGALVLLLGFVSLRAAAVWAIGSMRSGGHAADLTVQAAGHTAGLADPFAGLPRAEPEAAPLQELPDGELETGAVQGPSQAQGPVREAMPDESAVHDDVLAAVPEAPAEIDAQEQPAGAAVSGQVREELPGERQEDGELPPASASQEADVNEEFPQESVLPGEADGEAFPSEPALPEDEAMLPRDEIPSWLMPARDRQDASADKLESLPDTGADEIPSWLHPVTEPDALPDSSPAGEQESAADSARQETSGEMLPEKQDTGVYPQLPQ